MKIREKGLEKICEEIVVKISLTSHSNVKLTKSKVFSLSSKSGPCMPGSILNLMAQNGSSEVSGNRKRETSREHIGSDH